MRTKGIGPNNLGCSPLKLDKGKKNKKGKKPDYRMAETFDNYENASSRFTDFNSDTDTVFSATSIDPGAASRNVNFQSRISASKDASSAIPSGEKTYKTKNASGQSTYTTLKKFPKR